MPQSPWVYSPNCRIPEGEALPENLNRNAAVVSYDGSSFSGFQKQSHSRAIQGELERALSYVADEEVGLVCAGRTDAGVHASKQVIHFDSAARRNSRNWIKGVNSQLPREIRLLWVDQVPAQFHARFSALDRTYRYVIVCSETRPAILHEGVCWLRRNVDLTSMNQACTHLLGEQDFTAFRAANCQSKSCFRNVTHAQFYQSGNFVVFEITANAFLLHMVRNIVGSLLSVGGGARTPSWIAELLAQKDRTRAAPTAPPEGLYLVDVKYPAHFGIPRLARGPLFLPDQLND